jgi:hypothetical protein
MELFFKTGTFYLLFTSVGKAVVAWTIVIRLIRGKLVIRWEKVTQSFAEVAQSFAEEKCVGGEKKNDGHSVEKKRA